MNNLTTVCMALTGYTNEFVDTYRVHHLLGGIQENRDLSMLRQMQMAVQGMSAVLDACVKLAECKVGGWEGCTKMGPW